MTASLAVGSAAIEARTVRKVTVRIIPFVLILFVVNALDRNNIGFAALTMNKELGITTQQYGFIVRAPGHRNAFLGVSPSSNRSFLQ